MASKIYRKNGVTYHIHTGALGPFTEDELVENLWRKRENMAFIDLAVASLSQDERDALIVEAKAKVATDRHNAEQNHAEMILLDS